MVWFNFRIGLVKFPVWLSLILSLVWFNFMFVLVSFQVWFGLISNLVCFNFKFGLVYRITPWGYLVYRNKSCYDMIANIGKFKNCLCCIQSLFCLTLVHRCIIPKHLSFQNIFHVEWFFDVAHFEKTLSFLISTIFRRDIVGENVFLSNINAL